jgi:putative transposase
MTKPKQSGAFSGHRFPPEIIAYAVWAYHRFPMSLRDVEDLLAAHGVVVSYETIRAWVAKFGLQYAKAIRRDRPKVTDKWHLDEVVLPINGKKYWLWRAVDSKGDVLDILVQSRRNKRAAIRFFRKLFKAFGVPRVIVTDKLRSYGAALKELAPRIEHRSHKGHTDRPDGEKRSWGGSNRREKPSNFFPFMIRSKPSSARAATPFQQLPIARREPMPIGFGTTSRVSLRLLEI